MCSCKMDSAACPLFRSETPTEVPASGLRAGAATLRGRVVAGFSLDPVVLRFLEATAELADAGFVLLAELFGGFVFGAAAFFSLVDSRSFGIRNMRV